MKKLYRSNLFTKSIFQSSFQLLEAFDATTELVEHYSFFLTYLKLSVTFEHHSKQSRNQSMPWLENDKISVNKNQMLTLEEVA